MTTPELPAMMDDSEPAHEWYRKLPRCPYCNTPAKPACGHVWNMMDTFKESMCRVGKQTDLERLRESGNVMMELLEELASPEIKTKIYHQIKAAIKEWKEAGSAPPFVRYI